MNFFQLRLILNWKLRQNDMVPAFFTTASFLYTRNSHANHNLSYLARNLLLTNYLHNATIDKW